MADKESIRKFNDKFHNLKIEMENSTPYQIGVLLLSIRNCKNWHKIPKIIRKLLKKNRINIDHVDIDKFGRTDFLQKNLSRASIDNLLYLTCLIANDSGWDLAAEFVEKYASNEMTQAMHLVKANQYLKDEKIWLREINSYLKDYGILPLVLSDTKEDRFFRLATKKPSSVYGDEKISVIMPAFNASATIEFAARSILHQTWQNLELIIIDDCSTDDTWQLIQGIAASDPRVRALRNESNVGPYVSKNLALQIANGKYITGHDADDWAHPERLENDLYVILESSGKIKAVLSSMLRMNSKGELCRFNRLGPFSADGVSRTAAISLLIETDYFRKSLGAWDSVRFSADGELISRAQIVLKEALRVVPHIGMIGLDHPTSLSNDPVHGVSSLSGKSKTRRDYYNSYSSWHKKLSSTTATLQFPPNVRRFCAPEIMVVPSEKIVSNLESHRQQLIDTSFHKSS